jgi:hypothetical protein
MTLVGSRCRDPRLCVDLPTIIGPAELDRLTSMVQGADIRLAEQWEAANNRLAAVLQRIAR